MTPIHWRPEIWRKAVQVLGLLGLPILFWNRSVFVVLMIFFIVSYMAVELLGRRGIEIPILTKITFKSKRAREEGRFSHGAIFAAVAGIIGPYLFGNIATAIGMAQLAVADTASSMFGMKWGRRKLPFSTGKSWVGTGAFFITAFLISLPFAPIHHALLLGAVGSVVEAVSPGEMDNLAVPVSVSLTAFLIL